MTTFRTLPILNATLQKAPPVRLQRSSFGKGPLGIAGLPGNSLRPALQALAAAHQYAPEVRLHPSDPNFPSSVNWYLKRVRMRRHRRWWPDKQILGVGHVNVDTLTSRTDGGHRSGEGRKKTPFFVEIVDKGPSGINKKETRRGNLGSAECYVHIRPTPERDGGWDLQYWLFFPYNGFGPGHEGDWEHVTARVSAEFVLQSFFFASHAKESSWRDANEIPFNADGHPIVYVAKGSHACYWYAGKVHRPWLPDDHTAEGGARWRTGASLRVIGTWNQPVSDQKWIRYTGHWGEIGMFATSGLLVTSGPYGPAFQAWWTDDDLGNS